MKALVVAFLFLAPAAAAPMSVMDNTCPAPSNGVSYGARYMPVVSYIGTVHGDLDKVRIVSSSGDLETDTYVARCVAAFRFDPDGPLAALEMGPHQRPFAFVAPSANVPLVGRFVLLPHNCAAFYPTGTLAPGAQSTNTVRFVIATDGSVHNPAIAKPSGNPVLDQSALTCVATWRYRPTVKDGKVVEVDWSADVIWQEPAKPAKSP